MRTLVAVLRVGIGSAAAVLLMLVVAYLSVGLALIFILGKGSLWVQAGIWLLLFNCGVGFSGWLSAKFLPSHWVSVSALSGALLYGLQALPGLVIRLGPSSAGTWNALFIGVGAIIGLFGGYLRMRKGTPPNDMLERTRK